MSVAEVDTAALQPSSAVPAQTGDIFTQVNASASTTHGLTLEINGSNLSDSPSSTYVCICPQQNSRKTNPSTSHINPTIQQVTHLQYIFLSLLLHSRACQLRCLPGRVPVSAVFDRTVRHTHTTIINRSRKIIAHAQNVLRMKLLCSTHAR